MSKHVKQNFVKVALNKEDAAALRELARREADLRQQPDLGAATLLREYAMPLVHARLAEIQTPALRANDDRRSGDERRQPVTTAAR